MRNPEIIESYVPHIRFYNGIYLGEAIVTNKKDRAYIGVINMREKDFLAVSSVEL